MVFFFFFKHLRSCFLFCFCLQTGDENVFDRVVFLPKIVTTVHKILENNEENRKPNGMVFSLVLKACSH